MSALWTIDYGLWTVNNSNMKKIQTLLAVLFLLITPNLHAQPTDCVSDRYQAPIFSNIQRTNDITYGSAQNVSGNTQSLELDFYEPAPADEYLAKRPLVVMLFGGSFLGGDKQYADMIAWCDSLSRYGYACASVEYRLDNAFNFLFPDQPERAAYRAIQDGRAAIRFLLEDPNGFGFNIDRDHIYVGGNSAGAITAIHIAYADDSERPVATYAAPDQGCGDCSGNSYVQPFTIAGVIDLWGAIFDPQMIDAADNVPMVVVHSDDDTTVPYDTGPPFGIGIFPTVYGAIPMVAEMTAKNICHQFYPYQGVGHSFYLSGNNMNGYWPDVFDHGRNFLYDKTLIFDSPAPAGALTACVGDTETYSVPANPDSYFCWNVVNGTVVSMNNEQITVQWNATGTGQLELIETNCIDVVGAAQTIDVDVTACSCASMNLAIQFDGFPAQTSWEITDDTNGAVMASGGTYSGMSGNSSTTENTCLSDGCYTLNVYDAIGNGMCPFRATASSLGTFITPGTLITQGSVVATLGTVVSPGLCGNYSLTDANGNTIATGGGSFGALEANSFCILGGMVQRQGNMTFPNDYSSKNVTENTLQIRPNPARDHLTIDYFIEKETSVQIQIIDTKGRVVRHLNEDANQNVELNISNLPVGMYFLQLVADDIFITEKFIKK